MCAAELWRLNKLSALSQWYEHIAWVLWEHSSQTVLCQWNILSQAFYHLLKWDFSIDDVIDEWYSNNCEHEKAIKRSNEWV